MIHKIILLINFMSIRNKDVSHMFSSRKAVRELSSTRGWFSSRSLNKNMRAYRFCRTITKKYTLIRSIPRR